MEYKVTDIITLGLSFTTIYPLPGINGKSISGTIITFAFV